MLISCPLTSDYMHTQLLYCFAHAHIQNTAFFHLNMKLSFSFATAVSIRLSVWGHSVSLWLLSAPETVWLCQPVPVFVPTHKLSSVCVNDHPLFSPPCSSSSPTAQQTRACHNPVYSNNDASVLFCQPAWFESLFTRDFYISCSILPQFFCVFCECSFLFSILYNFKVIKPLENPSLCKLQAGGASFLILLFIQANPTVVDSDRSVRTLWDTTNTILDS